MKKIVMFLKRSRKFYILSLVLLNMAYISVEIYKSEISKSLLGKSITQLEFSKLETLSNYAYSFEVAFLITSIIWTLLMFSKKYKPSFKGTIFIQLSLLIILFIFNCILSWLFNAPIGNLTQLLLGPFAFGIGALIYFMLSNLISWFRSYTAKI